MPQTHHTSETPSELVAPTREYDVYHIGYFKTRVTADSPADAIDKAADEPFDWDDWYAIDRVTADAMPTITLAVRDGELVAKKN